MRKFSKSTTIVASIIIGIVLVIGFLFSYVPMTFGSKTLVSFLGSVNISSDIAGGMYGEYDITTEDPSESDLISSMARIREVFENEGYKNVNIYTVGNKKLRVEVSYPRGSRTYSDVYSDLSVVTSGKFLLNTAAEIGGEKDIVVDGSKCVKAVKVSANNSTNYISIEFNDYGKEQYEALCKSTSTIYIHLGTYNQSINASNVSQYDSFTLSDADYSNLIALQKRVNIGRMSIELDADSLVINTMSSSVGVLGNASSSEEKGFSMSSTSILLISALAVVIVCGIALFAVKFGLFAVVVFVSLLLNSYLFLAGLCLIPSIEIGFASIFGLTIGLVLTYIYTYIFASKVKSEYNIGKSFSASLDSAFKKTSTGSLIGSIAMFVSALIISAFSFGQITSATVVFAICAFLSIVTNICIIPFLVKVGISFDKVGAKLFMLKKREIGFVSSEEVVDNNVKESK